MSQEKVIIFLLFFFQFEIIINVLDSFFFWYVSKAISLGIDFSCLKRIPH